MIKYFTEKDIYKLNLDMGSNSSEEIINWSLEKFDDKVIIATAFNPEGLVIIDMAYKSGMKFGVLTVDTGRLPDETYELITELNQKYSIKIKMVFPDKEKIQNLYSTKGTESYKESISNRIECCRIRKIHPFYDSIKQYSAWFSGLRRKQSVTRSKINVFEVDYKNNQKLKINPLTYWSDDEVWKYINVNDIPYNKLHDKNYATIGCSCCNRPIKKNDIKRAGRWWWEPAKYKECGLHLFTKKSRITLYIDLDGTIIDTSDRHYNVYKDILNNSSQAILSKEGYWLLKRSGYSLRDILRETINKKKIDHFFNLWIEKIELYDNLKFDKIIDDASDNLDFLSNEYNLVLISGRLNRTNLIKQLKELDIEKYFKAILNAQSLENPDRVKCKLINENSLFSNKNAWIIGDTEADINAGKKCKINTVAVLSGLRNEKKIKQLKPDYIINNFSNVIDVLFEHQIKDDEYNLN